MGRLNKLDLILAKQMPKPGSKKIPIFYRITSKGKKWVAQYIEKFPKKIIMKYRKLLLAYIRKGDYAHAGEEEAIELAMNEIPRRKHQLLLDVGCGLGGTANYLEKNGWGKVIGIDKDNEVINYAKETYPNIPFYCCDVLDTVSLLTNSCFDVIYAFNSYFCFPYQEKSLEALASVANSGANLIIFDYSSPTECIENNPFSNQPSIFQKKFSPINTDIINSKLNSTGWQLKSIRDLTDNFKYWYESFLKKMDNQKIDLINHFGEKTYHEIYHSYQNLLTLINEKKIGGTIIYATKNM